jgi:hypothetical protein
MRPYLLSLTLFAATCCSLVRGDILANGNFDNGSAHWDGDRLTNTDATDLVIPLKKDNWTKISQTFNTRETCLKLSVTFSLSEDSTMLPKNSTVEFYLTDGVVKDVTGIRLQQTTAKMPRGGFAAFILDPTANLLDSSILGSAPTTHSQPSQGFFYHLTPHEQKTFYLCFPPGDGTVTLTNITLEPAPQGPANTQTAAQ